MDALKDLIRRACADDIFFGFRGNGPCIACWVEPEKGVEGLETLKQELGGYVFISGQNGRHAWLPSTWAIHGEEAIAVMRQLEPLLKATHNPNATKKLCHLGNTLAEWRARKQ